MLLLDAVQGYDDVSVVVTVIVADSNSFITGEGLPAHVGIELMAQACGAWMGANALDKGETVRLGFLLGTRRYSAQVAWFPLGTVLEVSARIVFLDKSMGVFGCTIASDGKCLAEAQLTVFQPQYGDDMLKEQ